ncbi:uncharacterized protein [Apostichopus japonicus]|uniref:uncharacterized protein n=1 Tax=Stichopus japonicus TaxID=307972 RepID=UPI003AB3ECF9
MTQFTIESLTRKDNTYEKTADSPPPPSSSQRKTFIDAMTLLSSGQPLSWDEDEVTSDARAREPNSSESGKNRDSSFRGSTETLPISDDSSSSLSPASSTTSSPTGNKSGNSSTNRQKPPHSYIALIAMAILNSSAKRLLLCDIYEYIMENFPYFRNNERSWRNSIRHNLSLNECFIKAGRSDDGRGHFWAIHPANMDDFAKGDFRRRRARRRVRAITDYDFIGYPYYPTPHLPGQFGYVPMTYSSVSSMFPSGITPYMTPRLPPHPATLSSAYISHAAAVTNTVPSLSSSPLPCLSTSPVSSVGSPPPVNRFSPPACTSSITSSPVHRIPYSTSAITQRPSTIFAPYASEPWTAISRTYHPYTQFHKPY